MNRGCGCGRPDRKPILGKASHTDRPFLRFRRIARLCCVNFVNSEPEKTEIPPGAKRKEGGDGEKSRPICVGIASRDYGKIHGFVGAGDILCILYNLMTE